MKNIKTLFISGITGGLSQLIVNYISNNYKGYQIRGVARNCASLQDKTFDGITLKWEELDLSKTSNIEPLSQLIKGCDAVIHTAAMKNVVECYNTPLGAIDSNILATENLIEAASRAGVKKFVNISSDMAVQPLGVYGATKLIQAALVSRATELGRIEGCNVRLGNIFTKGSSSIIHFFHKCNKESGKLNLTHPQMSRFGMRDVDLGEAILSIVNSFRGGETFIPKMKSYDILTIVEAVAPNAETSVVGMREGEKQFEIMVSENESDKTYENDKFYIIKPKEVDETEFKQQYNATICTSGFSLTSRNNPERFSVAEIKDLMNYLGLE
ncbi:MAG: polysaccharide biosynthesis protein [Rikenellaceae bacterium]